MRQATRSPEVPHGQNGDWSYAPSARQVPSSQAELRRDPQPQPVLEVPHLRRQAQQVLGRTRQVEECLEGQMSRLPSLAEDLLDPLEWV